MTAEQLAVLADDIADMAADFVTARDPVSLRNMATNLAGMIRIHVAVPEEIRTAAERLKTECQLHRDLASMQISSDSAEFAADIEALADYALRDRA